MAFEEMKLWCLTTGSERDWIAADDADTARTIYKAHYGLDERDMDDIEVSAVDDTDSIYVIPDETPTEGGDCNLTATDVMLTMTAPGIVCSTAY